MNESINNAIDETVAFLNKYLVENQNNFQKVDLSAQKDNLVKELDEVKNIRLIKNYYEAGNTKEYVSALIGQLWFRLSKFCYEKLGITEHHEIDNLRSKYMTSGIHQKVSKNLKELV